MAKILIVDDDTDLVQVIDSFLANQHYTVDTAGDGAEATLLLVENQYDAIVLDLHMPQIGGIELCTKLRAEGNMTPIIMLTGKGHIDDKEQGLDCGADDYLTKPFSLKELSARIRALIRRASNSPSNTLVLRDIALDPAHHKVTKAGKEVHLLPVDFALLEFLMRNPKKVFNGDALLAKVWASEAEATNDSVRSAIKRLRQKLDDDENESCSIIENIRRVGYRIRGDVQ